MLIITQSKTETCFPFRSDPLARGKFAPPSGRCEQADQPPSPQEARPHRPGVTGWLGTCGSLGAHQNFLRAWRFPWLLPAKSPSLCEGCPLVPPQPRSSRCASGATPGAGARGVSTQTLLSFWQATRPSS